MKNVVAALVACLSLCACGAELGEEAAPNAAQLVQVAPQVVPEPAPAPEPAPVALPHFSVVVAPPVDVAAVQVAIEAWNDALGFTVLELAPADTAPRLADHVYVSASRDLPRGQGGHAGVDVDWVYTIIMRPDLVDAQRTLAHELGHVLGGWGHSDVDGDLMFWREITPRAPVVISDEDVAQVRTWLNLQ